MRRVSAALVFFWLCLVAAAQIAPGKYFVEFTDKDLSSYSIDRPWEFLTQRALDRRAVAGIPIEMNDIPVNETYVEAVRTIGVEVLNRSRWFNGITIYTSDTNLLNEIELLPFVAGIVKSGGRVTRKAPLKDKFDLEMKPYLPLNLPSAPFVSMSDSSQYGLSFTQVHMIRTDQLHDMGFRGEGMVIAVLDAGFNMVDVLAPFQSLWDNDQILGTHDFVTPGGNVFVGHPHGMMVLSLMGGYLPGYLIGTAPKADYWLLRSEDTGSELLVEEYNWVCAAEFADSVGADVINSSLGYTDFDDTTQNHTCADMTGNTTPVTRGANIAFSKGILVVNSAGNEGGTAWQCVSAPSDGFDVLAVAAVDSLGHYASFSSTGVVSGSYVKPNVAAMGKMTVVANGDGGVTRGSGTSFSSPVMAGSAACLWQAFPLFSNATLKMAIEASGSQAADPDKYLGFGIPNLINAYERLTGIESVSQDHAMVVYPNPFSGQEHLHLKMTLPAAQLLQIQIADITGKTVYARDGIPCAAGENVISLDGLSPLPQGFYYLKLQNLDGPAFIATDKILKINR